MKCLAEALVIPYPGKRIAAFVVEIMVVELLLQAVMVRDEAERDSQADATMVLPAELGATKSD
jgi:hypothetical protein